MSPHTRPLVGCGEARTAPIAAAPRFGGRMLAGAVTSLWPRPHKGQGEGSCAIARLGCWCGSFLTAPYGLPNIQWLIENDGNIELDRVGPVACAAVASDEHNMLAALVRRDGESLDALFARLEEALVDAFNRELYIDEINC